MQSTSFMVNICWDGEWRRLRPRRPMRLAMQCTSNRNAIQRHRAYYFYVMVFDHRHYNHIILDSPTRVMLFESFIKLTPIIFAPRNLYELHFHAWEIQYCTKNFVYHLYIENMIFSAYLRMRSAYMIIG